MRPLVAGAVGLGLALVACSGGGRGGATAPGGSPPPAVPTVVVSPSVVVSPVPVPVPVPATGGPTAPPPPPAASPSGAPIGLVVTGAGSTLTRPDAPTTKPYDPNSAQCSGLLDPGFALARCATATSKAGTAVGLVEASGADERDLVWSVRGGTASLVLRRTRQLPFAGQGCAGSYCNQASTSVVSSDLAGDAAPKLVMTVPAVSGTGMDIEANGLTDLDVVVASGQVVLHRNMKGGYARKAFGGGLETYTPAPGGRAEHDVFQYRGGAWRLTSTEIVSSDKIPRDSTF